MGADAESSTGAPRATTNTGSSEVRPTYPLAAIQDQPTSSTTRDGPGSRRISQRVAVHDGVNVAGGFDARQSRGLRERRPPTARGRRRPGRGAGLAVVGMLAVEAV